MQLINEVKQNAYTIYSGLTIGASVSDSVFKLAD